MRLLQLVLATVTSLSLSKAAAVQPDRFFYLGEARLSAPDGNVIKFMDVTLKAVTPKTFKILSAALLKH